MPSHKHRLKTLRKSIAKGAENTKTKSEIKTLAKKIAVATTAEDAKVALLKVTSAIDKAAQSGVMHKRTAARRVSRLAKKANQA